MPCLSGFKWLRILLSLRTGTGRRSLNSEGTNLHVIVRRYGGLAVALPGPKRLLS